MSFFLGDFGSSIVVPSGRVTTMASLGSPCSRLLSPAFALADLPSVSGDHAAKRSQDRKRNLLSVGDRKKRPNPLLIRLDWMGFAVQFRQQGSGAENKPSPGQGHPALKATRRNFAELLA
jgi:hypothetical protein